MLCIYSPVTTENTGEYSHLLSCLMQAKYEVESQILICAIAYFLHWKNDLFLLNT